MPGGFGGGPWGGSPWGGGGISGIAPVSIDETVPISESVTATLTIRLVGAVPLSAFVVQATFSLDLDYAYPPMLSVSNYSIPGLTVTTVDVGPTPTSVLLSTTEQGPTVYTLTVTAAHSTLGDTLNPAYNTAVFSGLPVQPTFFAAAQSRTKVELIFSVAMLQNAAFEDVASYQIADLNGSVVPIVSATPSGPAPIRRVTLGLGSNLSPGGYYVATVLSASVVTTVLEPVYANTDLFQWAEMSAPINTGPIEIPIRDFSGEVSTGLLGQPLGQVFFSPALDMSAANSVIQVDEVSVCTQAYDSYEFPFIPDPQPLMTFGVGQPYSTLLNADALWATAERLGVARVNLSDYRSETIPATVDGPCDAVLQEVFDQSKVALLNVSDWVLFDGVNTSFICADNTAPIGPGTTTAINLEP
jgi:hypothetical protein